MRRVLTNSALRKYSWQISGFTCFLVLVIFGCRDKGNVSGPNPSPTGSWQISLENVQTLFVNPQHVRDTISVRLFDLNGNLAVNKTMHFTCEVDTGSISHTGTTTDTVSHPWGCEPALLYWGNGGNDQDNPHEVVHAYYIDATSHDTLADTTATYRVEYQP